MNNQFYLSIDFGTCNTVVSYIDNNIIKQLFDNISNDVLIPSTIYFLSDNIISNNINNINNLLPDEHFIIGNIANETYNFNKDCNNYFYQFKRFLGINSKSIEHYKNFLSKYNLDYDVDDDTIYFYLNFINSENKIKFNIIDLIKLYFKALHKKIIFELNITSTEPIPVIITCPAYFHDLQRSHLKRAIENSGFSIFKLCNEPTTAAIFYIEKFNKTIVSDKYIIFDLGGGTIDTTVIEYHSELMTCEVIDIDGNNSLGGIDIDNIIVFDIYKKYNIDKNNFKWNTKIKKCAEEFKIKLSYNLNYDIYLENVPIIVNNNIQFVDNLKISYSRHCFNNLINDLIDDMIKPIKTMYDKYNTNNIIFIGGPTQIPLLQNKVYALLNNNIDFNIVHDKCNNTFLYKTIVAQGANLLFKKISEKDNFCLLDIIPMNFGISDDNNNLIIMIEKNSKIPTTVEKTFTTSHDCQRIINIAVYEGINNNCSLNTFIGSYKIIGIPPLPRGMILIKLLFKISYNGILDISISGFKNSSDDSAKSFDFKLYENIKLIPNIVAKELLKKLLLLNEKK